MEDKKADTIIIGSGPAGLTAAIYTSRADLKTVVIAGSKWGGQLMLTTEVENFPGFPEGIIGPELMERMRRQAERFGTEIIDEDIVRLEKKDDCFAVKTANREMCGRTVIVSTGAVTRWLQVPGEEKLIGRGISSCAPCDAPFFKEKKVLVVGGGDAAMEEALVMTKFAREVVVVHRRDSFRASKIMQERVLKHPKITILWDTCLTEYLGEEKLKGVKLKNLKNGTVQEAEADGVFVAIGHLPATELFAGQLELDEKGFVIRGKNGKYLTMTNLDGVFAAGDVHDHSYKQAITAAGYGCEAALEVERWLMEKK